MSNSTIDYKKKLGLHFTAFEVDLRDVRFRDKTQLHCKQFVNGDDAERYMPRKTPVLYKDRKCITVSTPIMTGLHKNGDERWRVQLLLMTNNPEDYIANE